MKAIVYTKYGSPDVLKIEEVEKPVPGKDEVLVKIFAVSVNSWDWDLLRGKPFLNRLFSGLFKPKNKVIGCDIAGRIEAVGGNVKKFKPGDEVFGDICESWGGFAEYVCADEKALTLKPAGITFTIAASIPQTAVLAMQSLCDKKKINKGDKVLFIGAGGGVGTFALQIAKSFGAEVTCIDSGDKLNMLSAIGADHTIDYKQEDFSRNGQRYNLIIDVAACRSIFAYKRSLLPDGIFILVGGKTSTIFQTLIIGWLISKMSGKKMSILMHKPNKHMDIIKELVEAGKVVPVIDKCYPLSEVPEAMRYFGEGQAKGKVVINLEHNNKTSDKLSA